MNKTGASVRSGGFGGPVKGPLPRGMMSSKPVGPGFGKSQVMKQDGLLSAPVGAGVVQKPEVGALTPTGQAETVAEAVDTSGPGGPVPPAGGVSCSVPEEASKAVEGTDERKDLGAGRPEEGRCSACQEMSTSLRDVGRGVMSIGERVGTLQEAVGALDQEQKSQGMLLGSQLGGEPAWVDGVMSALHGVLEAVRELTEEQKKGASCGARIEQMVQVREDMETRHEQQVVCLEEKLAGVQAELASFVQKEEDRQRQREERHRRRRDEQRGGKEDGKRGHGASRSQKLGLSWAKAH
ncbi:uncharacterized protein B0I36DRAFT_316240 [Microdochium trichocladiopsis]|uniref:Uncharacterized protein n=1 Tax=Microdochium trichocladiopsis TaxID=1682393 RepID=A0A9P8YFT9_9PEZI|nr:uncharacterized protein B0I36DRAFT_316240 [Microdochium trichocladiopsis]KAH7038434.1 hypothetical protein B0I36DRAFT_316240 [Microdochium trichocladiopsis]